MNINSDIKIVVICGPSGVGKTSIASFLLKKIPNAHFCVSHTTRKPRITEMDGIDYYFVSKEKFQEMVDNEEFAEYASVYDKMYGTSWDVIEEDIYDSIKIMDVDYNGAEAIYNKYPEHTLVISVLPPSLKEVRKRLRGRGTDSERVIKLRMKMVEKELQYELQVPHVTVLNEDMRETQKKVMKCLK